MTRSTQEARLGWSPAEDALLFQEVQRAREKAEPLKAVFERVAAETGRRPNSIRNYYYVRIKQADAPAIAGGPAFVPFTEAEITALLREVLGAQARGMSVRACTLAMGEGDNRRMLRYQNKYRALIKNSPERVHAVIAAMRAEGLPAFDPYAERPRHRSGRPRGSTKRVSESLLAAMGDAIHELDQVEGLNVAAFFEGLRALAVRAQAAPQAEPVSGGEAEELRAELLAQRDELEAQRERFSTLLGYFRQLVAVNQDFLGQTSVAKMSSLSSYIRALSEQLAGVEPLMQEGIAAEQ